MTQWSVRNAATADRRCAAPRDGAPVRSRRAGRWTRSVRVHGGRGARTRSHAARAPSRPCAVSTAAARRSSPVGFRSARGARDSPASEVQISETETPLHRMETVYRRVIERLATADAEAGAFRSIVDGWFYALEQDVLADGSARSTNDERALLARTEELLEQRLASVSRVAPAYAATLRAYRRAVADRRPNSAEGLIAWLSGQPNVAAHVRRAAGIKGDIDHFGAVNFLAGPADHPARLRLCRARALAR